MKIPDNLQVDGEIWKIEKIPVIDNSLETHYWGKTLPNELKIVIDINHRTDTTFLHEIIHVVELSRSLNLTEEQVNSLAHGLYGVIIDNKLDFTK